MKLKMYVAIQKVKYLKYIIIEMNIKKKIKFFFLQKYCQITSNYLYGLKIPNILKKVKY